VKQGKHHDGGCADSLSDCQAPRGLIFREGHPQLGRDRWTTAQVSRLPAPVAPKAGPMPAHQCLGPNDRHCLQDRRELAIKQNKEKNSRSLFVSRTRPRTLRCRTATCCLERGILCLKLGLRLGWQHQQSQNKNEQRDHCRVTLRDSVARSIRTRFSVHTAGDFEQGQP